MLISRYDQAKAVIFHTVQLKQLLIKYLDNKENSHGVSKYFSSR